MEMFKIECYVEDRSLAAAMRALAACKVRNLTAVPVVNVAADKTGKPIAKSNGTAAGMLLAHLQSMGSKALTKQEVRDFMAANGFSIHSASTSLYSLKRQGYIRPASGKGSAGQYIVTAKGQAGPPPAGKF